MGNFLSTHEYIELENRKEVLYKEREELEEARDLLNSKLRRLKEMLSSLDVSTKRLRLYHEINYYENQLQELKYDENITKICNELFAISIEQDPSILEVPYVKTLIAIAELACLSNTLNIPMSQLYHNTSQNNIECNNNKIEPRLHQTEDK
jgi:predicted nuclease with TOPRIM domain